MAGPVCGAGMHEIFGVEAGLGQLRGGNTSTLLAGTQALSVGQSVRGLVHDTCLAGVLGCGQEGVLGYQARERQKVIRRRTGVRNRSATLRLALAKATSFCVLSLISLGQRKGRGAISDQLVGSRKKRGQGRPGGFKEACLAHQR